MSPPESARFAESSTEEPAGEVARCAQDGLVIEQVFSTPGEHPFDQIVWEKRTARITDEKGNMIFEQTDVEVPADWSQLATNVVASKYFYGEKGKPERETLRPPAGPPRHADHRRLGQGRRPLRHRRGRRALLPRADLPVRQPVRGVQLARCGSTWGCYHQNGHRRLGRQLPLGRRRQRARPRRCDSYEYPAGLGLLHPVRRGHDGRHHAPGHGRGDAVQVRLGHGHGPLHAAQQPGEALRRRQALGAAELHAGVRPDRRGGQVRRQDPPGGQDAVASGATTRTSGSSSTAR